MFESLKGILEETAPDFVVLGTASFSYKVYIPALALTALPEQGKEAKLFLHPVFREDDVTLYGFVDKEDRRVFVNIIAVNGMGPKAAMSLLSLFTRDEFIGHILNARTKALMQAAGIGKKGAERLILELKDKYKNYTQSIASAQENGAVELVRAEDRLFDEAVEALTSLGFSWQEASDRVRAELTDGITLEELIRKALAG